MIDTNRTSRENLTDILVDLASEGERRLANIDKNPGKEPSSERLEGLIAEYVVARTEHEQAEAILRQVEWGDQ